MSPSKSGGSNVSEHLTRNTEYDEALRWCQTCQRHTQHRRRPGEQRSICTDPTHLAAQEARLESDRLTREAKARQGRLAL